MPTFRPFILFPILMIVCISLWVPRNTAAADVHNFVPGSLRQIEQTRQGQPFLLILWSLDCATCLKEMAALKDAVGKHPGLSIVMISTDQESMRGAVAALLEKRGLGRVESWIFKGGAQQLRYQIDPAWFGELPRSYFYDASHDRLPHSGILTSGQIDTWVAATAPP